MNVKQKAFLGLNVICPLFVGLVIYLLFYESTYINLFFNDFIGLNLEPLVPVGCFGLFLVCWACDILWAYSLVFALYICFKSFKRPLVLCGTLSFVFAVAIEFWQKVGFINGTFDVWDIIFEIAAICYAVIIIKRRYLI